MSKPKHDPKEIVRRTLELRSMAAVARELNVSRQYIGQIIKKCTSLQSVKTYVRMLRAQDHRNKPRPARPCPDCGEDMATKSKRCHSCSNKLNALRINRQNETLAGLRFGKLVVLGPTAGRQYNYIVWRCRCDCGNEAFVMTRSLRTGNNKSCGCLVGRKIDIAGQKFGALTALEPTTQRKRGWVVWRCRCDCGAKALVAGVSLVRGDKKYCRLDCPAKKGAKNV